MLGLEPFELDEVAYYSRFNNRALAEAEASLVRQGKDINLLFCLPPNVNSQGIRTLFAASIHKSHPQIPFEAVQDPVTPKNWIQVIEAIQHTWKRDVAPDKDQGSGKHSPPEPQA